MRLRWSTPEPVACWVTRAAGSELGVVVLLEGALTVAA
jgi:hypothetical protein